LERRGGAKASPSELFTLGLFSLIDAIMNDSMVNLMGKLPLTESIKEPLVDGKGELGHYLRLVECYEKGDWKGLSETAGKLGLDEEMLPHYFREALGWADSIPLQ